MVSDVQPTNVTPGARQAGAWIGSPSSWQLFGNAFDTDPDRRVEISWDAKAKINRPVQIKVMTANRPGILATSRA
jgi:hypothetical protein